MDIKNYAISTKASTLEDRQKVKDLLLLLNEPVYIGATIWNYAIGADIRPFIFFHGGEWWARPYENPKTKDPPPNDKTEITIDEFLRKFTPTKLPNLY